MLQVLFLQAVDALKQSKAFLEAMEGGGKRLQQKEN